MNIDNYSIVEIHEECTNPFDTLIELLIQEMVIKEVKYINNTLIMTDENNIIYYLYGRY